MNNPIYVEAADWQALKADCETLRKKLTEAEERLTLEKRSFKRITLKSTVAMAGNGGHFILWHSACGLEQLEWVPAPTDGRLWHPAVEMKRPMNQPLGSRVQAFDKVSGWIRRYELRKVERLLQDGWGNAVATIAHYHEVVEKTG